MGPVGLATTAAPGPPGVSGCCEGDRTGTPGGATTKPPPGDKGMGTNLGCNMTCGIGAIICTGGTNGLNSLAPALNVNGLAEALRPFFGFSAAAAPSPDSVDAGAAA